MTHILFQIWRWMMHPKVWRIVGFAAAVVGLLCYALSSSFNYLYGEWNLLKIFLYTAFSFFICLVILFAKKLQHYRIFRFKPHWEFLVLTLTSVYSFFSDKAMNGKPDAYSLISCAAFAIMSLSLSRQTQCGFEIDLLYFFLGCLIVQLMKIKLQLFILGIGFSCCLAILRSSFSSLDAGEDNQYSSELEDGNSVILYVDSLQSPSVNISSASNSIGSLQLAISSNSMMEQLGTCVKALEHENSNLIQIISEHVKKYVEEHSQSVVTDPNLMMDALNPETINDLEEIAKVMLMAGFEKDFSDVYNSCRRECLNKCLMHRLFGLRKLNIEDVHNMSSKDLEDQIERWIITFNIALKILFPGERRLCDRIFFGFSSAADFSFMEICRESTTQLLNFFEYVATGSCFPEILFKILEAFEILRDLIPEFAALFCDQYNLSLRNEANAICERLGKTIRDIFKELEYLIGRDMTKVTQFGGGLHPITQHVMNYLRVVSRSQRTLDQVFYDSSLSSKIHKIMDTLERNLEAKSKCFGDPSIGYIFLINNSTYIVAMTKDNELGTILGDDWFRKHAEKGRHYRTQYQNTKGMIASTLVQDFFRSTNSGWEGSKVYQGERKKELETEIITIVSFPEPQFGTTYKMPPEDGFTWKEYGKKEIPGVKYQRSYYRCNYMKLYVCRAKKKVQQLDDCPNMFEVRYNGGHTCRMSLTIPSLFVPARHQLQISMVTQTTMPPSSTSYSGWISSGIPGSFYGKSINSMPEAKLAAPADGGHHPILAYLVSAIRSQQINVVNGDETFSLSAQTDGTMELLESTLASKSEEYADPSLRHFFMMNSWKYLEVRNRTSEMDANFVNNSLQKFGNGSPPAQAHSAISHAPNPTAETKRKKVSGLEREKNMPIQLLRLPQDKTQETVSRRGSRSNSEMDHRNSIGDDWYKKIKAKVQQNIELYKRNSWDEVLDILKLDINDSMEINFVVDLMKEKLSLFNKHFSETCRVQCTWSVHDYKLRKEIIESLKNTLLPAYGIFIGRFQDFLKNDACEYIEYGMFDIHDILDNLFLGNKKDK